MLRTGFVAVVALSMVGCGTAAMNEYAVWASQSTPESMTAGSEWALVILDSDDEIARALIVRFTGEKAETCTSGKWRVLEIISEEPARDPIFKGIPAYELEGRALVIDLTSNLCDNATELRGSVDEIGMSGIYGTSTPFGGERLGRFYGVRVTE